MNHISSSSSNVITSTGSYLKDSSQGKRCQPLQLQRRDGPSRLGCNFTALPLEETRFKSSYPAFSTTAIKPETQLVSDCTVTNDSVNDMKRRRSDDSNSATIVPNVSPKNNYCCRNSEQLSTSIEPANLAAPCRDCLNDKTTDPNSYIKNFADAEKLSESWVSVAIIETEPSWKRFCESTDDQRLISWNSENDRQLPTAPTAATISAITIDNKVVQNLEACVFRICSSSRTYPTRSLVDCTPSSTFSRTSNSVGSSNLRDFMSLQFVTMTLGGNLRLYPQFLARTVFGGVFVKHCWKNVGNLDLRSNKFVQKFPKSLEKLEPSSTLITPKYSSQSLWGPFASENRDSSCEAPDGGILPFRGLAESDFSKVFKIFSSGQRSLDRQRSNQPAASSANIGSTTRASHSSSPVAIVDVVRQRPNYFVAIPIFDEEIVQSVKQVQSRLTAKDKQLARALIPLESLHLTVLVMHLDEEVCLHTARAGLEKAGRLIREEEDQSELILDFSSISHFKQYVVFGKIKAGLALDRLHRLAVCVQEGFAAVGVPRCDSKAFEPHLTVAKLSRDLSLARRVKKINQSTLKDVGQMTLGRSTVTSLQLCSMMKPKTASGYYQVMHQIPLLTKIEKN